MSKEQRVYAHWKRLKGIWRSNGGNTKDNEIWLLLARTHKMKVRDIKDIIAKRKRKRGCEAISSADAPIEGYGFHDGYDGWRWYDDASDSY